jgi:hypothetical protein
MSSVGIGLNSGKEVKIRKGLFTWHWTTFPVQIEKKRKTKLQKKTRIEQFTYQRIVYHIPQVEPPLK